MADVPLDPLENMMEDVYQVTNPINYKAALTKTVPSTDEQPVLSNFDQVIDNPGPQDTNMDTEINTDLGEDQIAMSKRTKKAYTDHGCTPLL